MIWNEGKGEVIVANYTASMSPKKELKRLNFEQLLLKRVKGNQIGH